MQGVHANTNLNWSREPYLVIKYEITLQKKIVVNE